MGTKTNQGPFNCYAAALPDEEVFTLLARDPALPTTIRFWINERVRLGKADTKEDQNRLVEALHIANASETWRERNLNPHGDGVPTWKLPRPADLDDRAPVAETAMLSRVRISEFLDYATAYGEFDENTPIGTVGSEIAGDPMSEARRATIIAYKKVLGLLPENYTPEPRPRVASPVPNEIVIDREGFLKDQPTLDTDPDDLAHTPEVPAHRFSVFNKGERYAYAKGLEVSPAHLPAALDAMAESGWHLLAIFGETDSKHIGFIFERRGPSAFEIAHGLGGRFISDRETREIADAANAKLQDYKSGKPLDEIDTGLGRGQQP